MATKPKVLDSLFGLTSLTEAEAVEVFKEPTIPQQEPDSLLEDLQELRKVFATSKNWMTGAWGTPSSGSWCMEGGISRVAGIRGYSNLSSSRNYPNRSDKNRRAHELASAIEKAAKLERNHIPNWNDALPRGERGHKTIIKTIDKAIQTRTEELTLARAQENA